MGTRRIVTLSATVVGLALQLLAQSPQTLQVHPTGEVHLIGSPVVSTLQFEIPKAITATIGAGAAASGKEIQCATLGEPSDPATTTARCSIFGLNTNVISGHLVTLSASATVSGVIAVDASPAYVPISVVEIPPCDLTHDGIVDGLDMLAAVTQSLAGPCTDDLTGDSQCDAADVQKVVNAALGMPCVVP